jgi:hypothetical protein
MAERGGTEKANAKDVKQHVHIQIRNELFIALLEID